MTSPKTGQLTSAIAILMPGRSAKALVTRTVFGQRQRPKYKHMISCSECGTPFNPQPHRAERIFLYDKAPSPLLKEGALLFIARKTVAVKAVFLHCFQPLYPWRFQRASPVHQASSPPASTKENTAASRIGQSVRKYAAHSLSGAVIAASVEAALAFKSSSELPRRAVKFHGPKSFSSVLGS